MERMFLGNVSAHYPLSDSSHLPLESIRFFEKDQAWVKWLVDGALCLGNHTGQEADAVRDGIKAALNTYLSYTVTSLGFKPRVPRYGCYIRSALVTKFPDLVISTDKTHYDTDNAPFLLRHEIIGEGVMLCLFSQMPSKDTYRVLNITLPLHQQNFVAGVELDDEQIKAQYRKAYNVPDPQVNHGEDISAPIDDRVWKPDGTSQPDGHGVAYLWDNKGDSATGAATGRAQTASHREPGG
ncbi:hypothetical protein EDB81DRAFT_910427 [Dactylonectria macrodidyma]|uniref:Uncharacterized protein n=1 Tax=Dactylonectria macrodidyma TaxID=307937 RepID=A0A9P9IMG7_9HYPO|nr:hypothetical protein EDB81DRAFT_910427 [Dactylonectria macrodidyma]